MGNAQSLSTLTRTTGALDSFVTELAGDIVYDKSLGSARFLKTVKCRHGNGFIVVKIFIKPDPGLSLRNYHRRLKMEREALSDIANVYNYQAFAETEKAGYIVRQWVASNLYDRISTRPFLSPIEKKWIAFQLLTALRDARNRKLSHGDIKSENILVTSWNWLYLTDFASYKPTYLPLDDPADFSFFFDTSGRRTCYVAPERFYKEGEVPDSLKKQRDSDADGGESGGRGGKVNEAMDVFSAGCVIAELFLDGAPLFTLSQLFKYREGELSVDGTLGTIEDEGVRMMIKQMINLDSSARPTFDTLLHTARGPGRVFPECFYSFLHNYVSSINDLPSPSPFSPSSPHPQHPGNPSSTGTGAHSIAPSVSSASTIKPTASTAGAGGGDAPLPSDSDARIERIWGDYDSVEAYLVPEADLERVREAEVGDVKVDYGYGGEVAGKPMMDILPVELHIPNRESSLKAGAAGSRRAATEDGPALIILSLISANVRNCSLPSSKLRALDVFLALSPHLTDEAKLDRMVPYIVDLLHDEAAVVRAAGLRSLMQILMLVTVITPSNAAIFPEYIIPNIRYLVQDPEVSVRCTYAQCIVQLADTAVRYLEMGQALKAHGTFKLTNDAKEFDDTHHEVSYDSSLADLQISIQEQLSALLMDPSSVVKRAVLHNISSLCIFLGRQRTNDVLLSHMITYLNDRDWLLRYAFFESIVDVAACAGGRSLEEYILPLMIQALSDVEETVVSKVLAALTSLCELGLFQKMRIWELMSATLGFLYHPNIWIRQGAAAFISASAKHLPASDVWCILYPSLRHFLKSDIKTIDDLSLLTAMKTPLTRKVFDAAVVWAQRADKTNFWRGHRRAASKLESPRESVMSIRKSGVAIARNKSDEDEAQLAKLYNLGMSSSDEAKLLAMRDYILKLANAMSSFASRVSFDPEAEKTLRIAGDVELQKLGVVPQTVFLKSRLPDITPRSSRALTPLKSTFDAASLRTPVLGTPRTSRAVSIDHGGTPYEDLRRRLATLNASGSSLSLTSAAREHRSVTSPLPSLSSQPAGLTLPSAFDRPGSPTESVVSNTNSATLRPNRLYIGSIDGQKAVAAVGSSKANATGLLEAPSKLRSEGSPERSGRDSPHSTLRGGRHGAPSILPISTYDGQEPGISNLLENIYLDSNREMQHDFGPSVHEGPIRRRNAVRQSFASRDGTRRTEATLIAHLGSHSDAITGLAVSPDHMFFVSSSDDKTVKVWDTARLERNVTSKPRHTYSQHHARVKSVCILEGVHCFASAADDGSLHVVRVHLSQGGTLPKYNKLQVIREHRVEQPGEYITCMSHYNTDQASNLIYATTHSTITLMDLRTMRITQSMQNPRHFGPITCLCLDRKHAWIIVGTVTGVLSLWDRRFGLLLKSWQVGQSHNMPGRPSRVHQCVVHPTKGRGKWVIVAVESGGEIPSANAGTALMEVWDIEKSTLVEIYTTGTDPESLKPDSAPSTPEPANTVALEAESNPAAAIAALVRARQSQSAASYPTTTSIPGGFPTKRPQTASSSSSGQEASLSTPSPTVRAIIVGTEFGGHQSGHRTEVSEFGGEGNPQSRAFGKGFLISGSEDRKVRLWDIAKVERTAVLSGVESELEKPTYSTIRSSTTTKCMETWPDASTVASNANRPPQRMSLITNNQQNLLRAHQDIVTALACIDAPFRGGIVSGDRAGVIKVWRVDGAEHH